VRIGVVELPAFQPETSRQMDFERPPWCYLLWGVPAVVAVGGSFAHQASLISVSQTGLLWSGSVAWAGIGCFINGRTCGRVHCKIDGVLFPLLSLAGVLDALSAVSFSWNIFWIAFLVILAASFVPELIWDKYT
jgi:hypothetical protein